MNLQKKQLLNKTYQQFMEIGISSNNISELKNIVDPNVTGYGTVLDERLKSLPELQYLLKSQKKQTKGLQLTWKMKPMSRHIAAEENSAVFADDIFLQAVVGNETIKMYLRFSVSLEYRNEKWIVVHWHGSKPENVQSNEDTFGIETWKHKAEELEKIVLEKTSDLILKNRELQIESSLDKVRAASMAMKDSSEIAKVIFNLYTELTRLDARLDRCFIMIVNPVNLGITWWLTGKEGLLAKNGFFIPNNNYPSHKFYLKTWRKRKKIWQYLLEGKEKKDWDRFGFNKTELAKLPEVVKKDMAAVKSIHLSGSSDKFGCLVTGSNEPLSKEHQKILSRFSTVFNQTYTRFLDLQKAEAQAREAQIETSLERVRSSSLAMHHTSELQEVIHTVHKELLNLNIAIDGGSFIAINSEIDNQLHCWGSGGTADTSEEVILPIYKKPFLTNLINGIKKSPGFFTEEFTQQEKKDFFTFLFKHEPWSKLTIKQKKETLSAPGGYTRSCCVSKHTSIFIINHLGKKFSDADNDILRRFGKVFEQSYSRFLDLQKSEAQAREAQIEAALERVRSRAMAMHSSKELKEVAREMRNQFSLLGLKELETCAIHLWNESSHQLEAWAALRNPDDTGEIIESETKFNIEGIRILEDSFQKYLSGKKDYVIISDAGRAKEFFKAMKNVDSKAYNFLANRTKNIKSNGITAYWSVSDFHGGSLVMVTINAPDENSRALLRRFTNVFGQAYQRFKDLQKAEAQAREAQIEAALERIRSRSLAMHHSNELKEVIAVVFENLNQLKVTLGSVAIWLFDKQTKDSVFWVAADLQHPDKLNLPYDKVLMKASTCYKDSWQAWLSGKSYFNKEYNKQQKDKYFNYLFSNNDLKTIPRETRDIIMRAEKHSVNLVVEKHATLFFDSWYGATYSEQSISIFQRTAKVFEQAYVRFLDLQKAEAQAREAEIQLALERVRAKTMAMQKTSGFVDVINVLGEQFIKLGFDLNWANFSANGNNVSNGIDIWNFVYIPGKYQAANRVFIPLFDHPVFQVAYEKFQNYIATGEDFYVLELDKKEKNKFFDHLFATPVFKGLPEELKMIQYNGSGYMTSSVFLKDTWLSIGNYNHKPFTNEQNSILKRLGNSFGQAYTRFLDLQNAEAQTREAQIEAALERVRSRSMAMHKSDELKEVIRLVLEQFVHLKINAQHAGFYIDYKNQEDMHIWLADPNLEPFFAIIPYFDAPTWNSFIDAKAKGIPLHTDLLNFKEKNKFYKNLFKLFKIPEEAKEFYMQCKGLAVSTVLLENVGLYIENFDAIPYSEEENKILMRFGKVFQQAYTRFLDLQTAEAQAREAQIEAALEKVRSRSLAVHYSNEFNDVVKVVFENLKFLGLEASSISINTFVSNSKDVEVYICGNPKDELYLFQYRLPYFNNIISNDRLNTQLQQTEFFSKTYNKEEKDDFYKQLFTDSKLKHAPDEIKNIIKSSTLYTMSYAVTKHSMLVVNDFTGKALSQHHAEILKRFAKVFEQAYVRFLDLQKAEAQAREAQVEAALERVRAKTMAMQKSVELLPTAEIMFDQLKQLGAELQGVAFAICDKDSTIVQKWTSIGNFSHPFNIEPGEQRMYEAWKNQSGMYEEVYEGEKQKRYYELFMEIPEFRQGLQKIIDLGFPIPTWQKNYAVPFKNGYVLFIITKPFKETQIFPRFGKVFEQTYTRFLDLQTAETATKEAIKQAALDRIRADIAAMRTTKDLDRITPLIWNELNILGIPFIRCGVFIMDDEKELIHTFLSTPDGQAITAFHLPYSTPGNISLVLKNWQNYKSYIDHWDEQIFKEFAHTLVTQGALSSVDDYMKTFPAGGFYLHFLPFLQGMLYVGNSNQLSEEEINLVQSLADAFSTAYSRYEDFNKLEAAKKQVDSTLSELQATQKQLIQSEKMASLGELTAGIAHEIQNPLNFVNNFSEVSSELIDEMKSELDKGDAAEAKLIADDLKQNLEKINHHGKRADAIVKGMLQHSRTSTGKKEPTDINALCDEYLRLSYHGMRAKDKSFNAEMKTDFDESIGKINIIPQDIGRVILNLINNAFYACAERSRSAVNEQKSKNLISYEPIVSVTTKKIDDTVQIIVKDNGNGIPKNIVDKIFQPFFTTKPTGSGTGLGLSLSYDIVKAHGGEIKVEAKEGEGTSFVVQLPTG